MLWKKQLSCTTDKLWPYAPATWANRFSVLLNFLGLYNSGFTPACLRAGGATYEYLWHFSVGRLRLKGRWASEKSLDHYIQEATSLLAAEFFPQSALQVILPLSYLCGPLLCCVSSSFPPVPTPQPPLPFPLRSKLRAALLRP